MRWLAVRWADVLWLLVFGLASSAWCLAASSKLGVTFDEPTYMKGGLQSWTTGSNKILMRAGTMTLPPDVQTLPVYLWGEFRGRQFDPVEDIHTFIRVARAANLVFWWLLLVYAMRLGRTFGGVWGGRLAVALAACDPNLLGHASLATTDIACVACVLVLVYHFWHGLGQSWKRRVLVPGLCYGLAIQSKASGMVFGAEAMVVLGLWHLVRTGQLARPTGAGLWATLVHLWHACHDLRRDLVQIALIGFVAVFAYTGCDWDTETTFITWADQLPAGDVKSVMVPVSQHLRIFTNAGEGILNQIKHNVRGHGTFFLGEWHPKATWPYFPVALTMKVPLTAFALLAVVLIMHPRRLLTPPAAVALLLLALSPNYRVQIGVRFMFPMVVLTYVALSAAVANGWRDGGSRFVPRWFVAGIIAAMAATTTWVWPHGMSYFNQLWGGPTVGFRHLHDSNFDWGQGLPELKQWAEANRAGTVAVWYYGMDPAVYRAPFHRAFLSHLPHDGTAESIRKLSANAKYLAVSVGCLYSHDDITPEHRKAADWVRTQTPVASTRYFLIYRMR